MENKEIKKNVPEELEDDVLNEVSGGSSSVKQCPYCGRVLTLAEIEYYTKTGMCVACQLEQLRQQDPNLTNEELMILFQQNNGISNTGPQNTDTISSLSRGQ